MLRFRNTKMGYKEPESKSILSKEYTHTEKEINGQIHLIGDEKTIDLCNDEWAKNHFPDPKTYTLENLIKSGANLQETNVEFEQSDEELLDMGEKLNKKLTENKE